MVAAVNKGSEVLSVLYASQFPPRRQRDQGTCCTSWSDTAL